jgi:menaquinone-dependent protoporphyrinogen oxidase
MKPVLIAYATREGQTRRIAERIDAYLQQRQVPCALYDLAALGGGQLFFEDYCAAVLLASVHNGSHEPEAVSFAQRNHRELSRLPCLVLSVSSAQIMAESVRAPQWLRRLAHAGARKLLLRFLEETKLRTALSCPVAGALAFTKYTRALTWQFAVFARLARVRYDVTRDCDYTDMHRIEPRIQELLAAASAPPCGTRVRNPIALPH